MLALGGLPRMAAAEPTPKSVVATNATAPGGTNAVPSSATNAVTAQGGVVDAEARELKPHDTFRFRIEQDPTSGAEAMRVVITDSGEAHFNVSRAHSTYVTVKAAGRHLSEVRRELKTKLDAEFYRDASVNLDLEGVANSANNPAAGGLALGSAAKVQIFGEMQGTYPVPEGQRLWLSDVILALPRNDFANLKKIKVLRTTADGKPESHTVNINDVLNNNDRSADFELKDGDRVQVPRKTIVGF